MMKFENRVAVVTDGAGYIGSAVVRKLCDAGVAVAVVDITAEKAEALAQELREKGGNVRAFVMDIQNKDQIRSVAGKILAEFGKVDILINNAGVWQASPFSDMSGELWDKMIDINLNSVFHVTKAFLPNMLENGYGRIINLGSISGEVGIPEYCGYSSAKAGVIMLTKVLAMELAKKNITVNSVSPGMIGAGREPTPFTRIGRRGTAEEVADLLMFVASDDSAFITGVDYTIDGGRTLGPYGNN